MHSYQKLLILTTLLQHASAFIFPNDLRSTCNVMQKKHSNGGVGARSRFPSKIFSSGDDGSVTPAAVQQPQNFREAEVLGLTLMQEGQHEEALKVFQQGLKLPGSRTDIIRTARVSGPSPVGGSKGGTDGKLVQTLDEFEIQAAHYNIACAYASLGRVAQSCTSLEQAFQAGFDNYATVRADPDLDSVHGSPEFEDLMERYDSKKGFNPFGLFK